MSKSGEQCKFLRTNVENETYVYKHVTLYLSVHNFTERNRYYYDFNISIWGDIFMKKSKRLICTLLTTAIISSQAIGVLALDNNGTFEESTGVNLANNPRAYWWQTAWDILKAGANVANEWIYINPVYEKNQYYIKVGSGSIDFNNKTYGGLSRHNVYVDSTESEIDAWVERSFVDFFSKMVISLDSPSGFHSSKTVTHQQHFIVKPNRTGTWQLRYTTPDSKRWSCWFFYDPVAPIKSVSSQTLTNIETGEKITSDLYRTSEKMYTVPSVEFKNKNVKDLNNTDALNMDKLMLQTYDEEIGRFVNEFKDYSIGDTLIFEDSISNISYDKDIDATQFTFMGKDGDTVDWYFDGDLTNEYKISDVLKLKFKVVEEYSDENFTFETLDYIKSSSNGKFDEINNYLFK